MASDVEQVMRNTTLLIMFVGMFILASSTLAGTYVPWDELAEASWIDFGETSVWPSVYPANGGRAGVAESYPIAFSPAGGANKAEVIGVEDKHLPGFRIQGHFESVLERSGFGVDRHQDEQIRENIVLARIDYFKDTCLIGRNHVASSLAGVAELERIHPFGLVGSACG